MTQSQGLRTVDPVTVEVLQQSLVAITDQMFAVTRRTAMSSVIYEVLDFGVAITDGDGALASAGAGIPAFVGMLDPAVRAVLAKYACDEIQEGDVFISNDPYRGGVSHTNDVVVSMPVFHDGMLVAWTANKGHWMDIGGSAPGSTSPDATELFQEGLLLPEVKIIAAGALNKALFATMTANSRLPDQLRGDFWAAIASVRLGAERIRQLCHRYGREVFRAAVRDYLETAEQQALRGLAAMPQGQFEAHDRLDDGRPLHVRVTIEGQRFTVDLTGNPDQEPGPLNATHDATVVSAQAMFKSLVAPHGPANAGTFRPLRVLTREGSMFAATRPAATGLYYENKLRASDLILKAVAGVLAQVRAAGHFCSVCATLIGQADPGQPGRSFIEPEVGGWGARIDSDGETAMFSTSHGDTFTCPVEVNEARNGIEVERLALNDSAGGAGTFRGGRGIDLRYRILAQTGWVTAAYTRSTVPPWGLAGGHEGTVNTLQIVRTTGQMETPGRAASLPLQRGDLVWILTGQGGGYGDPRQRDRKAVIDDLKNGYITRAEALGPYGLRDRDIDGVTA